LSADNITGPPYFHISTGDVDMAAALAAFQQSVQDVFILTRLSEGPYELELSAWNLGTMMAGIFRSSALAFDRPSSLVASGGLDHVLVQLYVEGGFSGVADGLPVTVAAGEIVAFDLSRTLHTRATDFGNISLLIPRAVFESVSDDVAALHGVVLPANSPLAGVLASYMQALADRLPILTPGEARAAATATAALASTILSAAATAIGKGGAPILSPFRSIALQIEARLSDPALDAETLAAALNMSRATLYRAFEPVGGVADYIRRRRLTVAAVALAAPASRRRKIAEIAYGAGFSSESTFNRAFRAAFGISPREARERGAGLWTVPRGESDVPDSVEFARWLRALNA